MLENHFNNFKEEIIFDPNEHGKNKKHPSGCFQLVDKVPN
jgi:hypothetical protein